MGNHCHQINKSVPVNLMIYLNVLTKKESTADTNVLQNFIKDSPLYHESILIVKLSGREGGGGGGRG